MNPGTGTGYHPTALPTVGPDALPVLGQGKLYPGDGFSKSRSDIVLIVRRRTMSTEGEVRSRLLCHSA